MRNFKNSFILFSIVCIFTTCSKSGDNSMPPTPTPPSPSPPSTPSPKTNCVLTTISQVNSGAGAESSLSVFYSANYDVAKLITYDSVNKRKNFEADFNYVTTDSIRLDQYQYFKLDTSKRVIRFATKSDLTNPEKADDYSFEYLYNASGYLITKNLYVNGSRLPNFSSTYTYTNNLLTSCVMTAVSSGNLKVLESTLAYDNTLTIKNWIYTFPDAIEGYMYFTVLNFGNRSANPLKQIVTKIYDPTSNTLLDTWTTSYGNYKVDANGDVLSGEASGDEQQGIAAFFGKTNFYYSCH